LQVTIIKQLPKDRKEGEGTKRKLTAEGSFQNKIDAQRELVEELKAQWSPSLEPTLQ
jgi:hypothetical protein